METYLRFNSTSKNSTPSNCLLTIARSSMPQAILTPLPAGFSPWTIYAVLKTITHREQARTVRTSKSKEWPQHWKLQHTRFLGTARSGGHWRHRQRTRVLTVPHLVSEDSLLPQEHRTNLHNNQTHMVLNHLCSTFPFPKYCSRIYPVHLSSGKMDEPPSLLSSSALESQNVTSWKTIIPSLGEGN